MQRALVEQAMSGDIDAYSELVQASHHRLFGVANLILRDSDRAQDAVQDALLLAWRHVRSLRDPDAWDAWLRRLTVRACYKVASAHKRRTLVELHVTPDPGSTGAPDASIGVADRDWLGRELDRLDIDQRVVIVLQVGTLARDDRARRDGVTRSGRLFVTEWEAILAYSLGPAGRAATATPESNRTTRRTTSEAVQDLSR
jgi:DNA-directed RNA polymerase specialized sigma24 family protein